MSTLTYTYPLFQDGKIAYGSQVQKDFEDARTVINGGIDDLNLATAGITASAKVKAATVTAPLMAVDSVVDAALDYTSANAGVKVWQLGPNYPGASGGRIVRVEKVITIASVTTEQTFTVDWTGADAKDGGVTFSATPTPSGISFIDTGTAIDNTLQYVKVSAISTTGATVKLKFLTAPTGGSVTLTLMVAGAV